MAFIYFSFLPWIIMGCTELRRKISQGSYLQQSKKQQGPVLQFTSGMFPRDQIWCYQEMVGVLKCEAWWEVFWLFGYLVVLLRASVALALFTTSCHEAPFGPLSSPKRSEGLAIDLEAMGPIKHGLRPLKSWAKSCYSKGKLTIMKWWGCVEKRMKTTEIWIRAATMVNRTEGPQKVKNRAFTDSSIPLMGSHWNKSRQVL